MTVVIRCESSCWFVAGVFVPLTSQVVLGMVRLWLVSALIGSMQGLCKQVYRGLSSVTSQPKPNHVSLTHPADGWFALKEALRFLRTPGSSRHLYITLCLLDLCWDKFKSQTGTFGQRWSSGVRFCIANDVLTIGFIPRQFSSHRSPHGDKKTAFVPIHESSEMCVCVF